MTEPVKALTAAERKALQPPPIMGYVVSLCYWLRYAAHGLSWLVHTEVWHSLAFHSAQQSKAYQSNRRSASPPQQMSASVSKTQRLPKRREIRSGHEQGKSTATKQFVARMPVPVSVSGHLVQSRPIAETWICSLDVAM